MYGKARYRKMQLSRRRVTVYNLSQKMVFRGALDGASWNSRGCTFCPLSDHEDPTDPWPLYQLSKHENNDRGLSPHHEGGTTPNYVRTPYERLLTFLWFIYTWDQFAQKKRSL